MKTAEDAEDAEVLGEITRLEIDPCGRVSGAPPRLAGEGIRPT